MAETTVKSDRSISLFGATSLGVGAIVGGGILALAGVAFQYAGPAAMLAFAINGVIALLTALSFSEMAARFPQSGGTYNFAKKVLSVEAAFGVGWVVWFASIAASVLYAFGFAAFALEVVAEVWSLIYHERVDWASNPYAIKALALVATLGYTFTLMRSSAGGGQLINVVKVVVFGALIFGGVWVLTGQPYAVTTQRMTPFFPDAGMGMIQAMGFTFIALQGFDLVAAVAGEVKKPERNVPLAMLFSLGIALVIYLPLLFVMATVGVTQDEHIQSLATANPATVMAIGAENYLGKTGLWLVLVAGVLSMLSALQANLFAASRVALAMARDRTMPNVVRGLHIRRKTPVNAIATTAGVVVVLVILLSDVAAAGAASSLIFLITFALAHGISMLMRIRGGDEGLAFKLPGFPAIPLIGGIACLGLAVFQGVMVLSAGLITLGWLAIGLGLYLSLLSRGARTFDAASQALNPSLMKLRGNNPLVLVPIANPANARAMIDVAHALVPRHIGRVLLLSVALRRREEGTDRDRLVMESAADVLKEAFSYALERDIQPEALTTLAHRPLPEIARVAKLHGVGTVLLGFSRVSESAVGSPLNDLMRRVPADVVVLRAPHGWELSQAARVLVPISGLHSHDELRARLLTSLYRLHNCSFTFLRVLPANASEKLVERTRLKVLQVASYKVPGNYEAVVERQDDPIAAICDHAKAHDLMVLGLNRRDHPDEVLGEFPLKLASNTECPMLMLSMRIRSRTMPDEKPVEG